VSRFNARLRRNEFPALVKTMSNLPATNSRRVEAARRPQLTPAVEVLTDREREMDSGHREVKPFSRATSSPSEMQQITSMRKFANTSERFHLFCLGSTRSCFRLEDRRAKKYFRQKENLILQNSNFRWINLRIAYAVFITPGI